MADLWVRYDNRRHIWEVSSQKALSVFFDLIENFPREVGFSRWQEFDKFVDARVLLETEPYIVPRRRFKWDDEGNKYRIDSRRSYTDAIILPPCSQEPAVSPSNKGRLYFDGTKFRVSENGSNWKDLSHHRTVRVTNSSSQSIADSTAYVAINFDTTSWDTGGFHDEVTNNSRFSFNESNAGKYIVGGAISFEANATGARFLVIRKNGSTLLAFNPALPSSVFVGVASCSTAYEFVAGDYVELAVFQNSGGPLNSLAAGDYAPVFWLKQIE